MSKREIQELIRTLQEMAARIGCVFIPDEKKIRAFQNATIKQSQRAQP